jgi:hypothetical protein
MASDPKKRQKKLERRAAKRKSKRQQLIREKHAGLAERLAGAASYPILDCWATSALWTQGLGWVCLSREMPNHFVAFGMFLIDRYCLGVKNALGAITDGFDYERRIIGQTRSSYETEELPPAAARKLVEAAVAYAGALGFRPHSDYHKAKLIFGSINAADCTEEFEFGKDGKPLFIAGPQDTPDRCRYILKTLEHHCGPGGFHYMIPVGGATEILPESLQRAGVGAIGNEETGGLGGYGLEFANGADEEDE